MNNLPQNKNSAKWHEMARNGAKQMYLDRQANQMLAIYHNADQSERNAVIKNIDSFLEVIPKDAKIFWLKFRCKLERINEQTLPPVE